MERCEISDQVHELMQSISPPRRSLRSSLQTATAFTAFRTYTTEKPLKELEQKLHSCRALLELQYNKVSKYVGLSFAADMTDGMQ